MTTLCLNIRVRPETRRKLDAICRLRRWTMAETVDAVADDYVMRHGIAYSGGPPAPAADQEDEASPSVRGEPPSSAGLDAREPAGMDGRAKLPGKGSTV